jgi:hypothetical protein
MWEAGTQRVKIHREMIAKAHIYIICILYYKKKKKPILSLLLLLLYYHYRNSLLKCLSPKYFTPLFLLYLTITCYNVEIYGSMNFSCSAFFILFLSHLYNLWQLDNVFFGKVSMEDNKSGCARTTIELLALSVSVGIP